MTADGYLVPWRPTGDRYVTMPAVRQRFKFAIMGRSFLALQRDLCSGPRARARLAAVYGLLVITGIRGISRRSAPSRLRIQVGDHERDWWVADAMEVAALWEVFVAEEYGDWLPANARLVIDAGANVGTATAWFRHRYPGARVIAVEPNPDALERLRRNVGGDPNVAIVHAAVTDVDGTTRFSAEAMTTLGRVGSETTSSSLEVEALTLDTLRARYAPGVPVDVLKLDVEGSEWRILSGSLDGIGTVVMEAHPPAPDGRSPDAVLSEVADREGYVLRTGHAQTMAGEALRWLLPDLDSGSGVRSDPVAAETR